MTLPSSSHILLTLVGMLCALAIIVLVMQILLIYWAQQQSSQSETFSPSETFSTPRTSLISPSRLS